MATNVTGAWSTGAPPLAQRLQVARGSADVDERDAGLRHGARTTTSSAARTAWARTAAALEPARQYFNWMAKHEPHFVNRRSIANIGVVMGQRTQLFHTPPRGAADAQYMDGLYYALLEGRFLFDFVHEEKLAPSDLAKYSALLLPNTALLSDEQCRQIARLRGWRRIAAGDVPDQPLHRAQRAARRFRPGRRVRHPQGRRDRRHDGQRVHGAHREAARDPRAASPERRWIPGAENRVPIAPVDGPVLTVVPGYVAYPPELSYPDPGAHRPSRRSWCARAARAAWSYFPGDIERTMWRSGHTDLARLLQNAIRWVAGANAPVTIQGDGVIEAFAWETQAGFAVHVLNYTNPAMHRGWIREFYPIGAQRVRMTLPPEAQGHPGRAAAGRKGHPVRGRRRRGVVHDPECRWTTKSRRSIPRRTRPWNS